MTTTINASNSGSGGLIQTADASGVLALQTAGTTALTLSATQNATFAGTLTTAAQGIAKASLPAGSVLQVLQAVKTDAQSTTSTSFVDITSLSVTITPTSATSKILVRANINNISNDGGNITYVNLLKGSTAITSSTAGGLADTNDAWATGGGGGMANDNRKINSGSVDYLDSPATTSATTYKMQMLVSGGTGTVNRWQLNTDAASVSSITVMEIAA